MVCESCGEKKKCSCNKDFPKAVVEINNPEQLVLLRKVVIPASMGTEEEVPVSIGKYYNVLLQYEANGHIYLYSSDGIPTEIEANIPQEVLDKIAELDTDLAKETRDRELADNGLQTQIDAIVASSDVKDIVGTYAELEVYDTSTLGNNDIIKVLADETHDDATTYYRWSTTSQSFSYIGEEGPYYTKSQTDILLGGKQDTLTAGSNITIENNEISATDTTYSDFTGATSQDDGAAGLVPAPLAGDETKFLSGNGQWTTISQYALPIASSNDLGGIKVGNNLTIDPTTGVLDASGTAYTAGAGLDLTGTEFSVDTSTIQPKLTAGSNITIDANNEISATDTTYSAGNGIAINNTVVSANFNDVGGRRTYYIDGTNGNDNNDGLTAATAFKTLMKAIGAANTYGSNLRFIICSGGTYNWTSSVAIATGKSLYIVSDTGVSGITITFGAGVRFCNCYFQIEGASGAPITVTTNTAGTLRELVGESCEMVFSFVTFDTIRVVPKGSTLRILDSTVYNINAQGSNVRLGNSSISGDYSGSMSPLQMTEGSDCEINAMTVKARTAALAQPLITLYSGSHLSVTGALTDNTTPDKSYTYGIYSSGGYIQENSTYVAAYENIGNGVYLGAGSLYVKDNTTLPYTAGTNVSISGSTISATDTTYSNFVGTDGQAAGTAGLVPAPAVGDETKFLKGDGTWDSVNVQGASITMTPTDPGEGSPLAADNYIAVYGTMGSLLDMFYPVGSYYETSDTTFNPNTAWGGTWIEDTAGQVTVAYSSGDTDFGTVNAIGGEKTHQLSKSELPNINGTIALHGGGLGVDPGTVVQSVTGDFTTSQTLSHFAGVTTGSGANSVKDVKINVGSNTAHNNLQPYVVVKRWHRTA